MQLDINGLSIVLIQARDYLAAHPTTAVKPREASRVTILESSKLGTIEA